MTPDPKNDMAMWCWSCQIPIDIDTEVRLDEVGSVPCCRTCWEHLTVEQRLRLGQMFRDRIDGGVIDAMTTLFRSAFGRWVEESGGDRWLHGDGN